MQDSCKYVELSILRKRPSKMFRWNILLGPILFDLNSYYVVISDRSRIYFVDLGIIRGKYVKLSHIINAYTVVAESLCNVIV